MKTMAFPQIVMKQPAVEVVLLGDLLGNGFAFGAVKMDAADDQGHIDSSPIGTGLLSDQALDLHGAPGEVDQSMVREGFLPASVEGVSRSSIWRYGAVEKGDPCSHKLQV
jgi:hypothetical protein